MLRVKVEFQMHDERVNRQVLQILCLLSWLFTKLEVQGKKIAVESSSATSTVVDVYLNEQSFTGKFWEV